jgi:hypothetical protein
MNTMSEKHVKVIFHCEKDEVGWPPIGAEGVWAIDLGDGKYQLDNTPFFARGVAWKDLVLGRLEDGKVIFQRVHKYSGHSTIRIFCKDDEKRNSLSEELKRMGCSYEGIPQYKMVAIDVPLTVDLKQIQAFLDRGEQKGEWAYEEGLLAGPEFQNHQNG